MSYNPNIHHRHSICLKGYDYSKAGLYFITICCHDRACMFGAIENGEMVLNDAGKMIEGWYYELENKYLDKQCHEMVVMPNHFHCIIENIDGVNELDGHVCESSAHVGAPLRGRPIYNAPIGIPINWFKTMTTNAYIYGVKHWGWPSFNGKLWQRNYYEHIIRNEQSHKTISDYIINNPTKWYDDKFHTI